jgi:bifunctional N-acetylglucosamine-1-phosphate-uridyltransferase/glucosamine-1-phosphate-acetyltransferase GlmU-like protein
VQLSYYSQAKHRPQSPAGGNDKVQLAELERVLQQNQAHQFMQQGLMLKDPAAI